MHQFGQQSPFVNHHPSPETAMSPSSSSNPYQSPPSVIHKGVIYGDNALRRKGGFLYREIELSGPFTGILIYNGWWFLQRISLNGQRLWSQISWLTLQRTIDFQIPVSQEQGSPLASPSGEADSMITMHPARLQIDFDSRLKFRRFQLLIDEVSVYDEIV